MSGLITDENDEDWFSANVSDGVSDIEPKVELKSIGNASLNVCAFYVWSEVFDDTLDCDEGTPAQVGSWLGCCAVTTPAGTKEIAMDSIDSRGRDDDGVLYIHVFAEASVRCVPFELSFRF